uniref:Uncharacterized protein n=1 Tax=Solanum lycopersicum TaxID=4081 RepID=A0A3Q7GGU7_SOLLC
MLESGKRCWPTTCNISNGLNAWVVASMDRLEDIDIVRYAPFAMVYVLWSINVGKQYAASSMQHRSWISPIVRVNSGVCASTHGHQTWPTHSVHATSSNGSKHYLWLASIIRGM